MRRGEIELNAHTHAHPPHTPFNIVGSWAARGRGGAISSRPTAFGEAREPLPVVRVGGHAERCAAALPAGSGKVGELRKGWRPCGAMCGRFVCGVVQGLVSGSRRSEVSDGIAPRWRSGGLAEPGVGDTHTTTAGQRTREQACALVLYNKVVPGRRHESAGGGSCQG